MISLVYGVDRPFQQYFSHIVAVSFIGWGNRSTRRKPPTCTIHWQTLSHNVVSNTPPHEQDSNSQQCLIWTQLYIYKAYEHKFSKVIIYRVEQRNLSKWNLRGISFCIGTRQVFNLCMLKLTKMFYILTLFPVWFIQHFCLFRVRFWHDSLYSI